MGGGFRRWDPPTNISLMFCLGQKHACEHFLDLLLAQKWIVGAGVSRISGAIHAKSARKQLQRFSCAR